MEIIMRKLLMLAVVAGPTLIAVPAFASHVSPQTFANTPDPQAQQQAAAPAGSNDKSTAVVPMTGQFNKQTGQAEESQDPMDPDVNPKWLRGVH
jgi:hypothetical protein